MVPCASKPYCAVWNLDLFGLKAQDLSAPDAFTMQEVAEKFADAIMVVQPLGPWRIAAFCQSACLAIEVARVLAARTQRTSRLMLIDSFFSEYLPTPKVHLGRLLDFGPSYFLEKALSRFGMQTREAASEDIPDQLRDEIRAASKNDRNALRKRFSELCNVYQVTPYDGPINLFISKEFRHNSLVSVVRLASQGLTTQIVERKHLNLFQAKENEQGLAEAFDIELAKH